MKPSIKNNLKIALYLTAASLSGTASAHDLVGALTNGLLTGSGSGATDVYQVYCSLDPTAGSVSPSDHLYMQVTDQSAAGGQISLTAIQNSVITSNIANNTKTALTVTDTIPADGVATLAKTLKAVTPAQDLAFTVIVHHTAAAADNYLATVHCQDASNLHTGTSSFQLQDQ